MVWFNIWELLSVIFQERSSTEQNLSINFVVLEWNSLDVAALKRQGTLIIHDDRLQDWFLVLGFFHLLPLSRFQGGLTWQVVRIIYIFLVLLLIHIIEFAVEVIQKVLDCQKHHFPVSHRVIVILSDDGSGHFVAIFSTRVDIEIRWKVIMLDFQGFITILQRNLLKNSDCFRDSVLQLEVVDVDYLVRGWQLGLEHYFLEEFVVSFPESYVQDLVSLRFLPNFVGTWVNHRIVLEKLRSFLVFGSHL